MKKEIGLACIRDSHVIKLSEFRCPRCIMKTPGLVMTVSGIATHCIWGTDDAGQYTVENYAMTLLVAREPQLPLMIVYLTWEVSDTTATTLTAAMQEQFHQEVRATQSHLLYIQGASRYKANTCL